MSSSLEQQELFDYRERLVGRRDDADPVIRLEIYGILIMAFSVCLTLALITFSPADVTSLGGTRYQPAQNLIGPIGAHLADLVLATFGLVSFLLAPLLGLLGLTYLFGRRWRIQRADLLGWMGMMIASAVVIHVALSPAQFLGHVRIRPDAPMGGASGGANGPRRWRSAGRHWRLRLVCFNRLV